MLLSFRRFFFAWLYSSLRLSFLAQCAVKLRG
jgi:hypothetical protein